MKISCERTSKVWMPKSKKNFTHCQMFAKNWLCTNRWNHRARKTLRNWQLSKSIIRFTSSLSYFDFIFFFHFDISFSICDQRKNAEKSFISLFPSVSISASLVSFVESEMSRWSCMKKKRKLKRISVDKNRIIYFFFSFMRDAPFALHERW